MQNGQQPRQRRSARYGTQEAPRRAQYPEDARQTPEYPQYPNYPSQGQPSFYSAPPQQRPYQQPQAAYPPRFEQNAVPPQAPVYPAYSSDGYAAGPVHRRHSHDVIWLLVIIVSIALLILGGFTVSSIYSNHYPAFRQKVALMDTTTFYDGVHVDGIHIGGLTREQARRVLQQSAVSSDQNLDIKVTIDGKTWHITQNELPLSSNIEAVLDEAYSIGRQGSLNTLQSRSTPFEYRYLTRQAVNQNGAYLYTEVTYDKSTARSLAETLSSRVSTPAQNATVYSFDFASRSFQFQPEQAGTVLSSEEIYSAITAAMDGRNYTGTISLSTQPQQPAVTAAQLQRSFGLVGSYTTTTLAGYNRNINIRLACSAINGTVVDSGKTFSFNETTGRRSVDKGYLPAGAIAQGESIEDTGGGVCQVSSTLFNAAILANLEIVRSVPHAWPSAYVEPGRDATVDWQDWQKLSESVDFKFKNSSDYPIFIVAYFTGSNLNKACKCTVELYGVSMDDGIAVDVQTVLTRTTEMPTPAPVQFLKATADHPAGTSVVATKGREGYVYETYRVFYQNGQMVYREKIRTSNYKPYAEQVREYIE